MSASTFTPSDKKMPRLTTGIAKIDNWIDGVISKIERNSNITATPPLRVNVGPTGIAFSMAHQPWQWAKSGSSGIPAMSGSTPGKADDVILYDFDGTDLTSQTVEETAYNMGADAVAASAWILLARIDKYWFVLWEDCGSGS